MSRPAVLTVALLAAVGLPIAGTPYCLSQNVLPSPRLRGEGPGVRRCGTGPDLSLPAGGGRGQAEHPARERIRVEHDAEAFSTTISIRSHDGRVAWSDVLRGLARARGYDDRALQGVGGDHRLKITGKRWRVLRVGLNLTLRPDVRFDVEQARQENAQPWLVIKLDRAALLASKRRFKARLRSAWLRKRPSTKQYGLVLDEGWNRAPPDQNLVVVVHGLDSGPERLAPLLAAIRKEGFSCASFRYPNDQPIADSAKLLSCELKRLARQHPRRGVSLVTSSMGGLVARAVVEDPRLDCRSVRQLIMVAPPNHGSALARFGFGLDLWEHLSGRVRKKEARLFYALVEDGLSEAAADLRPGSPFLRHLNARGRNPRVRYTILLGTGGPLRPVELALLRKSIAAAGRPTRPCPPGARPCPSRWVRFFGARVHTWLEDLDEVVEDKGDGAVSVERGRLEGVNDTVLLKFRHVPELPTRGRNEVDKLYQEVLQRLKAQVAGNRGGPA
jgi:hypothetical protein